MMPPHFVCLLHVTDLDTCGRVEGGERLPAAGCVPLVVDEDLRRADSVCVGHLTRAVCQQHQRPPTLVCVMSCTAAG